jgi:hypothetical protein
MSGRTLGLETVEPRLLLSATFQSGMELRLNDLSVIDSGMILLSNNVSSVVSDAVANNTVNRGSCLGGAELPAIDLTPTEDTTYLIPYRSTSDVNAFTIDDSYAVNEKSSLNHVTPLEPSSTDIGWDADAAVLDQPPIVEAAISKQPMCDGPEESDSPGTKQPFQRSEVPVTKPPLQRIDVADLPPVANPEGMVDIAMVAELHDLQLTNSPSPALVSSDAAQHDPLLADPAGDTSTPVTVDRSCGRGQLFELAMATGRESGLPTATISEAPAAEAATDAFVGTLAEAGEPLGPVASPTRSSEAPLNNLSQDDTDVAVLDMACAEMGQAPVADAILGIVALNDDTQGSEGPEHQAAFAQLADDDAPAWSAPLYFDDQRQVHIAAFLVTTIVAGRIVRPQESESTPRQTRLLPRRRGRRLF